MAITTAARILDPETFELWLNQLPDAVRQDVAVVMASRNALRVLPLLHNKGRLTYAQHGTVFKLTIWRVIMSRSKFCWPAGNLDFAPNSVSAITQLCAGSAIYAAEAADLANVDATYSSARAAQCAADAATVSHASASIIWQNIRSDGQEIDDGATGISLHSKPLWRDVPAWWQEEKQAFELKLKELDPWNEQVYVDWYEAVSQGQPAFGLKDRKAAEALERAIALGGKDGKFHKEFWDREPGEINRDIAEWVAEARVAEVGGGGVSAVAQPSQDDFLSLPASVETTGRSGIVELLHRQPLADVSKADLESITRDLGKGLQELAAEADAAQADKRITAFLRSVADAVKQAPTQQELLFESGRNYAMLDHYSTTVDAEWGPFLAAKYHAVLIQFDGTLKKFASWRAFIANPHYPIAPISDTAFDQNAEAAQQALNSAKADFEPAVLEKLQFVVTRFRQSTENLQFDRPDGAHVSQTVQLLQSDYAVSLANVVTSYAHAGLVRLGGQFVEGALAGLDKVTYGLGWAAVLVLLSPVLIYFHGNYPHIFDRAMKAVAAAKKLLSDVSTD